MNVLICDDEWRVTEQVSELLQKHCAENGMQVRFHLFDDPCAIKDLAGCDIAILDIDMGDFSGIDLVETSERKTGDRDHFSDQLHPVCAGRV